MEKLKNIIEHLVDFKWIYIVVFLILGFIGWWIYYEWKYPCVSGHYETQYFSRFDANGNFLYTYTQDVFICDCRTIRDSLYNTQNDN